APETVGANWTRMAQVAPLVSVVAPDTQSPVMPVSTLKPVAGAVIVMALVVCWPVLVTVMVRVAGVPMMTSPNAPDPVSGSAAGVCAVPVSALTAVPPGVAATVSVADFAPAACAPGRNLATIWQVALADSVLAMQASDVISNWLGSAPPSATAIAPAAWPPV